MVKMKNKILLFLCMTLMIFTTACGSGKKESSRYEQILKCEGRYVQRDEDSADTYGANVSFYEKNGNVYANIEYSGFMGTIEDGLVEDSKDSEYLYEMHPKGDFYGEQDFTFLFNEEKMYIAWGSSEYTLTKSDGSPEDEEDQKTPFDETELYQTIVDQVDGSYSKFSHKCSFDRDSKILWICVEAPEGLRSKMGSNYEQLKDSWDNVVETSKEMNSKMFDALVVNGTVGGLVEQDVYKVNFYMVDHLKDNTDYSESETVLAIENGNIVYNLANEYKTGSYESNNTDISSYGNNNNSTSSSYQANTNTSSSTNSYDSSSASAGERNALEKAHQYLDYTAFSYSGLVDQLKYEGYSDSEAKYAADHCGADWYEQAVKKAQDYLDYTSFSREGLQEQLEYEGFTYEQAAYGVKQAYR